MREEFLHYLWRHQRFDCSNLLTTQGHAISLLARGDYNRDAGPDFADARLRINSTLWAGHVEIHVLSSDWLAHGHHEDPAYDNVILHVVLEEDEPVFRRSGSRIPCLELRGRIPPGLIRNWWRLQHNEYWVPCQYQLGAVPELTRSAWLDRLAVERLQRRTEQMARQLQENSRDWEETFYQYLVSGFGLKVNADAFAMLARITPCKLLLRHRDSLRQLEALLFGQAGLLPADSPEEYPQLLAREYALLQRKYNLQPLAATAWKFMRLRPANFPTVRLAQLAMLLHRTGHLAGKVLAAAQLREIYNMFELELGGYWRQHYRFGTPATRKHAGTLGPTTLRLFLINAIIPFIFLYGQERDDPRFRQRALDWLAALPAEDNRQIRQWKKLGWPARSALQSQALLELKHKWCEAGRCLDCSVGHVILNRSDEDEGPTVLLTANEEARIYRISGER